MDREEFGGDERNLGFSVIQNRVIDEFGKQIGPYGLAVYAVIVRHCRNGCCWPSKGRIAELIGTTAPTVAKAVATLVQVGLMRTERRTRPDGGNSSLTYWLTDPPVNDVAPPAQPDLQAPRNDVAPNKTNGNNTNGSEETSSNKPEPVNPSDMIVEWNRCLGLVPVHRMTAKRVTALSARCRDPEFVSRWREAIERAAASDFLCGSPGPWKADIEWFLKPDSLTKILEGKYDNRQQNGKASGLFDSLKRFAEAGDSK